MTYIEFFEKHTVDNLCACLVKSPSRVIFIGDNYKQMVRHTERYRIIFQKRGKDIEFICKSLNRHNISGMVELLSEILDTYDDCAFGLTGGDELFLVAMGIVFERYRNKNIQMHKFNVRNNSVVDCDLDGNFLPLEDPPFLSIWENIYSHGGDLVEDPTREDSSCQWKWEDGFREDINAMWKICRRHPKNWNGQIGVLAALTHISVNGGNPMKAEASVAEIKRQLKKEKGGYVFHGDILKDLYAAGLLKTYEYNKQQLSIEFKNEQIKRCLTKAGQALEMKVYLEALQVRDEVGTCVYNDVRNGVCIDWDGAFHDDNKGYDTENEIDVMMMHGLVPVFVSCKNGRVDMDELYKLHTVASRFGGKYAKKVLIASSLDKNSDYSQYLRQRARDMQIRVVDSICEMSDEELSRTIRTFWIS